MGMIAISPMMAEEKDATTVWNQPYRPHAAMAVLEPASNLSA
jgi:hypothetical protein